MRSLSCGGSCTSAEYAELLAGFGKCFALASRERRSIARLIGREERFHLAPDAQCFSALICDDIAPANQASGGQRPAKSNPVRKSDRQRALRELFSRRQEPAPDRVSAFSVENFAEREIPFRNGDRIATKARGATGRLATQRYAGDGYAEFKPNQV